MKNSRFMRTKKNHQEHNLCIKKKLAKANEICEKKGVKFTPLRQKILELLLEKRSGIKAYTLLEKISETVPHAKPPTVYRALSFLIEHDLAHKINHQNSYIACQQPETQYRCYFLICSNCKRVEESDDLTLSNSVENTTKHHKFEVEEVSVEIFGRCKHCNAHL